MEGNRVIDRLLQYLEYKGINNSAAEKQLNLSNAYLKNTSKPGRVGSIGSDILAKVEEVYLDLCLIWLITGKGEMIRNFHKNTAHTPNENTEVRIDNRGMVLNSPPYSAGKTDDFYKNVSPTTPQNVSPTVSPTLNFGLPHIVTVDSVGRENVVMVPIRARAGYLIGYGDPEYIQKLPSYNIPGLRNGSFRAFEVDGHSMNPTLKNHDIAIGEWVESLDDMRDERVYIIVTKTKGVVIKRALNRVSKYGFIVAKSDNITNKTEYPNLQVYPDDIKELWYCRLYISSDLGAPSEIYQRLNDLEAGFEHLKNRLKQNDA